MLQNGTSLSVCGLHPAEVFWRQSVVLVADSHLMGGFQFPVLSAEDSSVQKQLLIRDKFRSNTRKISRIVAEKGVGSLQDKVAGVTS